MTIRIIQSNDNGSVENIGDFCFSGLRSFTRETPFEVRSTLFIHKVGDRKFGTVFRSVWTGQTNDEGQFIFVCVSTPQTMELTDTPFSEVHLMSDLKTKEEVFSYIS